MEERKKVHGSRPATRTMPLEGIKSNEKNLKPSTVKHTQPSMIRRHLSIKPIALAPTGTSLTIAVPEAITETVDFETMGKLTETASALPILDMNVDLFIGPPGADPVEDFNLYTYLATAQTDEYGDYKFIVNIGNPGSYVLLAKYAGGCFYQCIGGCVEACIAGCIGVCMEPCIEACILQCVWACIEACTTECVEVCIVGCVEECVVTCVVPCVGICIETIIGPL